MKPWIAYPSLIFKSHQLSIEIATISHEIYQHRTSCYQQTVGQTNYGSLMSLVTNISNQNILQVRGYYYYLCYIPFNNERL
jgi:hypothetical protein